MPRRSVLTLRRPDEVYPYAFFLSSFFASTGTLDIAHPVQLGTDFFDHFIVTYYLSKQYTEDSGGPLEALGCLDIVCYGMNDRYVSEHPTGVGANPWLNCRRFCSRRWWQERMRSSRCKPNDRIVGVLVVLSCPVQWRLRDFVPRRCFQEVLA